MPIYAVLLGQAAAAFGKQLALDVGKGLVETLFNQAAINRNLEEIKQQLLAIAQAISQLPGVFYDVATQVQAETAQRRSVEMVNTVVGSLLTLQEKRAQRPYDEEDVRQAARTLNDDAKRLFEEGGFLMSYGQAYYATVSTSFLACIKAYAELLDVDPDLHRELVNRLVDWQLRLSAWTNVASPGSLAGVDRALDGTYQTALNAFALMDERKVNREPRYLLSWQPADLFGVPSVRVYAAWFLYNGDHVYNGDELSFSIPVPAGVPITRQTVLELAAPEPYRLNSPQWFFDVLDNQFVGRPAYDACLARLAQLSAAVKEYPTKSPPAKDAVNTVNAMLAAITAILADPTAIAVVANAEANATFRTALLENPPAEIVA